MSSHHSTDSYPVFFSFGTNNGSEHMQRAGGDSTVSSFSERALHLCHSQQGFCLLHGESMEYSFSGRHDISTRGQPGISDMTSTHALDIMEKQQKWNQVYKQELIYPEAGNTMCIRHGQQDIIDDKFLNAQYVSADQRLREKIKRTYEILLNCSRDSCNSVNLQQAACQDRERQEKGNHKAKFIFSKDTDATEMNCLKDGEKGGKSTYAVTRKSSQHWHASYCERIIHVPLSQRMSAQLWAIRLAEGKLNADEKIPFFQIVLLAKVFRLWHVKLRVARLLKEEEKRKDLRASKMYNDRLICKSFVILKAYARRKRQRRARREKKKSRELDRDKLMTFRQKYAFLRLLQLFRKWKAVFTKVRKFTESEDKITEVVTDKLKPITHESSPPNDCSILMSQVYVRWKQKHSKEQREGIASLHFKLPNQVKCPSPKIESETRDTSGRIYADVDILEVRREELYGSPKLISLLHKVTQHWRLLTAERRVKNRMMDVARIHVEQLLFKKIFYHWKSAARRLYMAKRHDNEKLLRKSFLTWKAKSIYTRLLRQRCLTSVRNSHALRMLRRGFDHWRRQALLSTIVKEQALKERRRVFTIWTLKHQRNALHRKLYRAQARKARKKRFFFLWKTNVLEMKERRKALVKALTLFQERHFFHCWRATIKESVALRKKHDSFVMKRDITKKTKYFMLWLRRKRCSELRNRCVTAETRRSVKQAVEVWRGQVKERQLERVLNSHSTFLRRLRLRVVFDSWKRQYQCCKRNDLRAMAVQCILDKGRLSRVFLAWQIVTQEDCIISPLKERIERRELARTFDAWRFVVLRKAVATKFKELRSRRDVKQHFSRWRSLCVKIRSQRDETAKRARVVTEQSLACWQEYFQKVSERRLALAARYAKIWRSRTIAIVENRTRLQGDQVLLIAFWTGWKTRYVRQRENRCQMERQADNFKTRWIISHAINRWKRQKLTNDKIRAYCETRRKNILAAAFEGWWNVIKDEIHQSINGFKSKLLDRFAPAGGSTLNTSSSSSRLHGLLASKMFGSAPNLHQMSSMVQSPRLTTVRNLHRRSGSLPQNWQRSSGSQRACSPFTSGNSARYFLRRSPKFIQSQGTLRPDDIPMSPVMVPPRFSQTLPAQSYNEEANAFARSSSFGSQSPPERPEVMKRSLPFMCSQKSFDDDVMLTSGFHSYNGYGADESDDETMSYASFQTQTESFGNYSRENFVSDTLRHWKFLPMSITFRAWLKYTQERRLHQDLFCHMTEKKGQRMMQTCFLLWHRKAYCQIVAEEFRRKKCLSKGLNRLATYAGVQRVQHDRNLVAHLHFRNSQLHLAFSTWKKKAMSRKKILQMVNIWQSAAVSSDTEKEQCARFAATSTKRLLRASFKSWTRMRERSALAREFGNVKIMIKAFAHWHGTASNRKKNSSKLKVHLWKTVIGRFFYVWQKALENCRKADENAALLRRGFLSCIVQEWQLLVQVKKTHERARRVFQQQCERRVVRTYFNGWLSEMHRFAAATDHANGILLEKVFQAWQYYSDGKINLMVKMRCFRRAQSLSLLQSKFHLWKKLSTAVEFQRRKQAENNRRTMRRLFLFWRHSSYELKAVRTLKRRTISSAFHVWKKGCFQRQREQRITRKACKKWIAFMKERVVMKKLGVDYFHQRNLSRLRVSFMFWQHSATALGKVKFAMQKRLAQRSLKKWYNLTVQTKYFRSALLEWRHISEKNKLTRCFIVWYETLQHKRRQDQVIFNYLELKKQEMLQLCMENFRMNAIQQKGEKFWRKRILKSAFLRWMNASHRRVALRRIRRNLLRMRVREKISAWKTKIQALSDARQAANDAVARRNKLAVRGMFEDWLRKARKHRVAKIQYEKVTLRRCMKAWRARLVKCSESRNLLKQFEEQRDLSKMVRLFAAWKDKLSGARHLRELEEVHFVMADDHNRKKILERVFSVWRNEVLVGKATKTKEGTLQRKYFDKWKSKALFDGRAKEMYENKLYEQYEKYWSMWRKNFIKAQVTAAMQVHDKKTTMSEVFTAWHSYAFMRQRLRMDLELTKKRSYFRKWMDKYNKS